MRTLRTLPAWTAPAVLGVIMALAAVLYGWSLGSLGWANSFYSAAVKSMGRDWTNFLFGSYDPAGVVTVDKPPAALWPQVISSKIFGMHGWALVLPQTIEGVAAVFVLHRTVRRWAGEGAGLIAALVLTLTPITVAINRDNNPDTLLTLLLVTAAYALTRALQAEGRAATWWLCGSGFLIGCGFLTKMLAAWMVVPAFALAWLVGARGRWLPRVWRLLGAGAVLAVSSLWWVALVALLPVGERPYIGGSDDGSAWNLVIGYNGLGRVFGNEHPGSSRSGGGGGGGFGGAFGGGSGPGRMFGDQVGGQISWLLPLCALALVVAAVCAVLRRQGRLPAKAVLPGSGWLLWGTWLVVCAAVFSGQEGIFHPYYTTELAPAIAALTGGLAAALLRVRRAGRAWAGWAGAVAVAVSAGWAAVLIRRDPNWHGWLLWPVLLLGLAAVGLLLFLRRGGLVVIAVAVAAVLVAPAAWAVSVPASKGGMGGSNPTAGPSVRGGFSGGRGGLDAGRDRSRSGERDALAGMFPGGSGFPGSARAYEELADALRRGGGLGRAGGSEKLTSQQRAILAYAVKNAPDARIKLAVEGGAMATSAFILDSDETVVGIGGFMGSDDAPSVAQLQKWTQDGELRYILGTGSGTGRGSSGGVAQKRAQWISAHCTQVPAARYGGASGGSVLYDCAAG